MGADCHAGSKTQNTQTRLDSMGKSRQPFPERLEKGSKNKLTTQDWQLNIPTMGYNKEEVYFLTKINKWWIKRKAIKFQE